MTISPALAQLFQSLSLAGVVTLLVNLAAPFLEAKAPFAKPGSSTHDATLRALNLLLNVGLALGSAALLNQLTDGQAIMAVIGFGIAQATGSHLLYTSGNRPAPMPAPQPASAPQPAPVPSLASAAATSAAAVADAINAAIAAHTS